MNIVALNSSKNWGGNERWLTTALNGLSSRGHQIHLIKRHNTDHWNSLSASINVLEAPFTNELSIKTKKIIDHYSDCILVQVFSSNLMLKKGPAVKVLQRAN